MAVDEIINSEYKMRTPSDQRVPFDSDQISLQLHSNCMTHHEAYCLRMQSLGACQASTGFRHSPGKDRLL